MVASAIANSKSPHLQQFNDRSDNGRAGDQSVAAILFGLQSIDWRCARYSVGIYAPHDWHIFVVDMAVQRLDVAVVASFGLRLLGIVRAESSNVSCALRIRTDGTSNSHCGGSGTPCSAVSK